MTQKERLVELLKGCPANNVFMFDGDFDLHESLADHLLSNGVIVPSCKVGDVVWITLPYNQFKSEVTEIYVTKSKYIVYWAGSILFYDEDIGKNVFFTREEAEQAVKERDGK